MKLPIAAERRKCTGSESTFTIVFRVTPALGFVLGDGFLRPKLGNHRKNLRNGKDADQRRNEGDAAAKLRNAESKARHFVGMAYADWN